MDPAAFSLETATTFISALTLFLSRLDSRRRLSGEIPNLRNSLIELSAVLLAWVDNAQNTNFFVRQWVERGDSANVIHERLKANAARRMQPGHLLRAMAAGTDGVERALMTQQDRAQAVKKILATRDDAKSWQSVRHLLGLYGPELIQVLDIAIAARGRLLEELGEELVRLRETSPEELANILERLESTSQKLDLASTMISEYIREKFPLNEVRPLLESNCLGTPLVTKRLLRLGLKMCRTAK